MWAVVRELTVFIFFLLILLVISYRMRNSDTFLYKNTMEQLYIKSKETAADVTFDKVSPCREQETFMLDVCCL